MSCEYQYTKYMILRIFMRVTIPDSQISAAIDKIQNQCRTPQERNIESIYILKSKGGNESAQKETPSIKVQTDIICHMVMGSGLLVSI